MYGNAKDYYYHFKYEVSEEKVRELFPDLDLLVESSYLPDYVSQVFVFDSHNIDEVLEKLRATGLDPIPEHVAGEPWAFHPEKETYEEYRVRIGIAK
ncbi:MAG: hypothetical protein Q4E01_05360 [Actinomycetaceae bacterium]|nr:hypothetical protein [Actinomycetaceae bacterium]